MLPCVVVTPPCGFANSGSTCYLNATTQALLSCPTLMNYMHRSARSPTKPNTNAMVNALLAAQCVSPTRCENPLVSQIVGFLGRGQQCAMQCFEMIVDKSVSDGVFEFYTRTTLTCPNHHTTSVTELNFTWNISKHEHPDERILHTCDVCGATHATMRYERITSPPVLAIMYRKFDGKFVSDPGVIKKCTRDRRLVAQICHVGSVCGGHYYAYCLRDGCVYQFNDTSVSVRGFSAGDDVFMEFYV